MSEWDLKYEQFKSYDQMLEELRRRPNNRFMRNEHDSDSKGNVDWYGTNSLAEAYKLLGEGYVAAVKKMKTSVEKQIKANAGKLEVVNHARPANAVVGYIPNVPNALRGLPQSMITVNIKPMKKKTLHIMYVVGGSSGKERSYFENAGIALLSAVDLIEKSGIQTKIDLSYYCGKIGNEVCMPSITIKNYGERYSVQKVSFPLAHTAMMRRIGFKWLETFPDMGRDFSGGYGTPLSANEIEEVCKQIKEPNTHVISTAWINDNNCEVEEIMKKLGVTE